LVSPHDVGIWGNINSIPVLLASTTIDNNSTTTASTSADGRWLFNDIALVTLTPGEYVIAANYLATSTQDAFMYQANATTVQEIVFGTARLGVNQSSLAFPDQTYPSLGYACFGPDLALVPEPSTLFLLGSSLAGLGGFAWRTTATRSC
jgi:hypothetical protein